MTLSKKRHLITLNTCWLAPVTWGCQWSPQYQAQVQIGTLLSKKFEKAMNFI